MIQRENPVHWEALVYMEMFVAGIAAGAYLLAAILELIGRGRSPTARSAHLLAFPLMALVGILLTIDLSRPERFWHMIVMNQRFLPMFKLWSPMSLGSWLVLLFPIFAVVSFVDALVDRGLFRLGGWRHGRTLHGTGAGKLWAILGGILAFAVAAYSGVLLNASSFEGWASSPLIGAVYVATAMVTGLAAIMLVEAIRGAAERDELRELARAGTPLVLWQILLVVLMLITAGQGARVFLTGGSLLAIVAAAIIGGALPLVLLWTGRSNARPAMSAVAAILILLGGLLLRAGIVMGPQHG